MLSRWGFRRRPYVCYSCLLQLPTANGQCRRSFVSSRFQSAELADSSRESFLDSEDSQQFSVPAFTPTESDRLNEALEEVRKHYVIPWSLPKRHRSLLFNQSSGHTTLTTWPGVTVTTTTGERIKLEPLPERPALKKNAMVYRITKLMKRTNQFENLPTLLEAFKTSRSPVRERNLEALTRSANELGNEDIIFRCIRMVDKTGATLKYRAFTREVFLGLHYAGQRCDWSGKALEKALKQAESLATKMEVDVNHIERPKSRKDPIPLRMTPEIAGVLLELSAALAVNDYGGVDKNSKVAENARKVLVLWDNGQWEVGTNSPKTPREPIVSESTREKEVGGDNVNNDGIKNDPNSNADSDAKRSDGVNNSVKDVDNDVSGEDTHSEDAQNIMDNDSPTINRRLNECKHARFYVQTEALLRWLPLYHGLRLAEKVGNLDSDLKAQLSSRRAEMDQFVPEVLEAVSKSPRAMEDGRALSYYRRARLHL